MSIKTPDPFISPPDKIRPVHFDTFNMSYDFVGDHFIHPNLRPNYQSGVNVRMPGTKCRDS